MIHHHWLSVQGLYVHWFGERSRVESSLWDWCKSSLWAQVSVGDRHQLAAVCCAEVRNHGQGVPLASHFMAGGYHLIEGHRVYISVLYQMGNQLEVL